LGLQIEQSDRKARLIQDRRDKVLREYDAIDSESPSRILAGLKRVSARIEYELARKNSENFEQTLKQIESQSRLLVEQQAFARDHLISSDATLADLQKAKDEADTNAAVSNQKVAALQPQLLNALSADNVNPSLELLRKQQLTRASTEAELAQLQVLLVTAKADWYQFRAGVLETGFDIQAETTQARRATEEALKQVSLWSSISQSTLITPSSDPSLNAVKNLEIAQSVARDTLALVSQIRSTSDDLLLIQEILRAEFISSQSGIRNTGARLKFAVVNAWDRLRDLSGFHLFNIGDTPVTPAGLFKMLFILSMALGISWLIRYLLTRGARKKNAAQSPAFYALGRILHYIIVMAGSFAALGSIGIDFTSFALIAGALSVGIGFGLQAIVSNFVSGLILLFEGTLRVGDFIELEGGSAGVGFRGVVKEINTRATVITTNDSVDLVVPNSVLVTTQLTNWTLRESYGRLRVLFGVAYGTDKELVKKVAIEAIGNVESALTHMPGREPQIRLTNFGDSSLEYTALFWVSRQGVRRPGRTRAEFLWELETLLNDNGIEIPFPQRDIHVVSDFRARQDDGLEPETSEI
ncbi:MAG: mechanosensitive ion channel domain-containing protein, partial [Lysobacterales bacterium]